MKYIVEVVVCAYNDDGERWNADGRIVGEFDGVAEAQVVADKMVKAGTFVRDALLAPVGKDASAPAGE